jgi:hypothetical protein
MCAIQALKAKKFAPLCYLEPLARQVQPSSIYYLVNSALPYHIQVLVGVTLTDNYTVFGDLKPIKILQR